MFPLIAEASQTIGMIDFPIGELMNEAVCLQWLTTYLHLDGLR